MRSVSLVEGKAFSMPKARAPKRAKSNRNAKRSARSLEWSSNIELDVLAKMRRAQKIITT